MNYFFSNNFLLVPLTPTGENIVYRLFNDKKVLKFYVTKPIKDKSETLDVINKITANGNFTRVIKFRDNDKKVIGICSLHHWNKNKRTIEIGGTLFPEYWGKGIMLEAFNTLVSFAFAELNVKSVIGRTLKINTQANTLVLKLGFRRLKVNGD